jgi:hypothetical protein
LPLFSVSNFNLKPSLPYLIYVSNLNVEQVELETRRGAIDIVIRDVSSLLIRRAAASTHQENSSVL